jgi:hypothetical protein
MREVSKKEEKIKYGWMIDLAKLLSMMKYMGLYHLLKWNPQKLLDYSTNMCWSGQETMVSTYIRGLELC